MRPAVVVAAIICFSGVCSASGLAGSGIEITAAAIPMLICISPSDVPGSVVGRLALRLVITPVALGRLRYGSTGGLKLLSASVSSPICVYASISSD